MEIQICALPDCKNTVQNWRTHFCCKSHAGKYSSFSLPKLESKVKGCRVKRSVNGSRAKIVPTDQSVTDLVIPRRVKNAIKKNLPIDRRKFMGRNDLLKLVTPKWANKEQIAKIYKQSIALSESGQQHHVDHIIPLNHPLVCGLHVEHNLQILTKEANSKKNNRFTIL